jgi:hypothetical protein
MAGSGQKELSGVYAKIVEFVDASLCKHAQQLALAVPKFSEQAMLETKDLHGGEFFGIYPIG